MTTPCDTQTPADPIPLSVQLKTTDHDARVKIIETLTGQMKRITSSFPVLSVTVTLSHIKIYIQTDDTPVTLPVDAVTSVQDFNFAQAFALLAPHVPDKAILDTYIARYTHTLRALEDDAHDAIRCGNWAQVRHLSHEAEAISSKASALRESRRNYLRLERE